jgi:hypothetical protein
MIELQRCYEIFDCKPNNYIDEKVLRKKYHKLCLEYHPDKTRQKSHNVKENNISFNEIKYAYETLKYKNSLKCHGIKDTKVTESKDDIMYEEFLSLINNEYIYGLMKNISYKYFNQSFDSKYCITLNISLEQLFERNLYFENNYNVYIPLWHHHLMLKSICDENNLPCNEFENLVSFKINTTLPKNMILLPNNDIIIIVDYKTCKKNKELIHVLYSDKIINIELDKKVLQNRYVILHEQGIYRPNPNNIYDHSQKSNLVFVLL